MKYRNRHGQLVEWKHDPAWSPQAHPPPPNPADDVDPERVERCAGCGEAKKVFEFARARHNKHRSFRSEYCRDCALLRKNAEKREERLDEVRVLSALLDNPDRAKTAEQYAWQYQWFQKVARKEPGFEWDQSQESILSARRRWLLKRIEEVPPDE